MDKRLDFINELLKFHNIGIYRLSLCYEENKDFIDNFKQIFDCADDRSITLCSVVTELVCPENAHSLKKQLCENLEIKELPSCSEEEAYNAKVMILTAMYYDPYLFAYALNWTYFLECGIHPIVNW
jgi:hypothetical protein